MCLCSCLLQRNYRKKLKRRLEDLERRAASTSASPEQTPRELPAMISDISNKSRRSSNPPLLKSEGHQQLAARRLSSERTTQHDHGSSTGPHSPGPLTRSPSPSLTFATYPPADTSFYSTISQPPTHHSVPAHYGDYPYTYSYSQPYAPTLPPMLPSNGTKHETIFGEEEMLSPFSMNYASMAGMEVPSTQDYWSTALHVNPSSFPTFLSVCPTRDLNHLTHSFLAEKRRSTLTRMRQTPPLTDPFSLGDSRESSPSHPLPPATPTSIANSPPIFDLYSIADV